MSETPPQRVLFSGYAPVHFLCFQPLYEALVRRPGLEVFFSGGLRERRRDGVSYDAEAMYRPYGIPQENILSVEQIQDEDFDLLFASNTKYLPPREARTRIQLFHGISFRNRAIRAKNMACDYYFMVGPRMRRRFADAGLMEAGDPRAIPIGFMKTDPLVRGAFDRDELLAGFGFRGDRPVVLYAPTGLRNNSLEIMGEDLVRRLATSGKYDVVVKLHDHPKDSKTDWPGRLSRFEDEHCRLAAEQDVIPLLFLADLLISDASSVSNEYMLMNRPVVFIDVPKLIAASKRAQDSMIDVDRGRWAGLLATSQESVEEAVDIQLENPKLLAPLREASARDLFFNPGHATHAAVTWLEQSGLIPPASDVPTNGQQQGHVPAPRRQVS